MSPETERIAMHHALDRKHLIASTWITQLGTKPVTKKPVATACQACLAGIPLKEELGIPVHDANDVPTGQIWLLRGDEIARVQKLMPTGLEIRNLKSIKVDQIPNLIAQTL